MKIGEHHESENLYEKLVTGLALEKTARLLSYVCVRGRQTWGASPTQTLMPPVKMYFY